MRLRMITHQTLLALQQSGPAYATEVSRILGDKCRRTTAQKLVRMVEAGLVNRVHCAGNRIAYELSRSGLETLEELNEVRKEQPPVPKPAPKKQAQEPVPPPAPPKGLSAAMSHRYACAQTRYVPPKDTTFYREDGNKHIKSLGAF